VNRVREAAHPAKEFSSEIHQRSEGGYEVTPAKEGDAHSAKFTVVRTMVTIVHSHTSDAGLGSERGSRDQNVARGAQVNVITVYPGGAVSRIDTRGNVSDLKGGSFVPRP